METMLADPRRQQSKVHAATTYIIALRLAIFRLEIPVGAGEGGVEVSAEAEDGFEKKGACMSTP